jgi:cystathionine beta-lyase
VEVSKIIVNETKLFKVTVSFGNVVSLISLPCYMSHASIPAEVRAARGLPDDLVRISAGIEDPQDLIADLSRAMDLAAQHLAKKQAAAAAASGNGAAAAAAAAAAVAGREQELLERVQSLEEQLQGLKGLLSRPGSPVGPVPSNGTASASHS